MGIRALTMKTKQSYLKLVHVTAPATFDFEPTDWDASDDGYLSPDAAAALGVGPDAEMLIEVAISMARAEREGDDVQAKSVNLKAVSDDL